MKIIYIPYLLLSKHNFLNRQNTKRNLAGIFISYFTYIIVFQSVKLFIKFTVVGL